MDRTILIVEDSAAERAVLTGFLKSEYNTIEAANGKEALKLLREKARIVSAVIMDVAMPGTDGFETLHKIREVTAEFPVPVIIATALNDDVLRKKAIINGADNFITKPYNRTLLLHIVQNVIRLRETAAIAGRILRDSLTGLLNRDAFFDEAEQTIRQHGAGYYILSCFDVENFKVINDQYGTETGDRVLKHIADCLSGYFTGTQGLTCRYMADKFAILYPASAKDSAEIAEIHRMATQPACINGTIRIRVGRYLINDLSIPVNTMFDRAAMAEDSVRGSYERYIAEYNDTMRERIVNEQKIVNTMVHALAAGEFEPWFQPQYNHATGAMIGAEALVRWKRNGKYVSPSDFIPVFERNGFIFEMDQAIWRQVCALVRRWLDDGINPLPISVNVSRRDLLHKDCVGTLTGIVDGYRLPYELIRLEVTESAFAESSIVDKVDELIRRGFTVEIDDFGSGYSSLNTLKDVPAPILKLDMKFFENTKNSQRSGNIIESVVRMAKWLGMTVIAEGVEDREQADYLKTIGCYYIQGYYYAEPMPSEDYENLLQSSAREPERDSLRTLEALDNNEFWNPHSIETLIFNSYVGGACIFEYHNGETELLRMNERYTREMGGLVAPDALLTDASMANLLTPTERAKVKKITEDAIVSKQEETCEVCISDGKQTEYIRITNRVIAQAGDRWLFYAVVLNMTEQRLARQREKEVAEKFRAVLNSAENGITAVILRGGKTKLLFANEKFYSLHGVTAEHYHHEELYNQMLLVHPDDRDTVKSTVSGCVVPGQRVETEYRLIRPDGRMLWMKAIISVTTFAQINAPVQVTVFMDITADREADEQLRFLNNSAHDILAQPDCNLAIDRTLDNLLSYFDGDRAYIIELDDANQVSDNTYERCAPGIVREREHLQHIPYSVSPDWFDTLRKNNNIVVKSTEALPDDGSGLRALLLKQNIQSLIISPLLRDGTLVGFAGIDNPKKAVGQTDRLRAIGVYIAVLLTRRDLMRKIENDDRDIRLLMNDTPGGFLRMEIRADNRPVAIAVNDGFCRMLGITREEATTPNGGDAFRFLWAEDRATVKERSAAALADCGQFIDKCRLRRADGTPLWVGMAGRFSRDENGDLFLNAYFSELTDLKETEARQIALLDNLPCCVALYEYRGDVLSGLHFNHIYRELLGRGVSDGVGTSVLENVHPDDRETARAEIEDAIRSKRSACTNLRIRTGDGSYRLFRVVANTISEEDGTHLLFASYTPLNGQSKWIREMNFELDTLLHVIPCGVLKYSADEKEEFAYINRNFVQELGYTEEQFRKKFNNSFREMIWTEDREKTKQEILRQESNGKIGRFDYRIEAADGNLRWFHNEGVKVTDADGKEWYYVTLVDITERKEVENNLRLAEEEYRVATRHSGHTIGRYSIADQTLSITEEAETRLALPELIPDVPYGRVKLGKISPDTADAYIAFYENIIHGGKEGSVTFRKLLPSGWRWITEHSTTIFDEAGKPVSAIISYADVTEHQEKEIAYKKWQQELQNKRQDSFTLFRCNLNKNATFDSAEGSLLDFVINRDSSLPLSERMRNFAMQCVVEEDRDRYIAFVNADVLLADYYRGKRTGTIEFRGRISSSKIHWLRLTVDLVEYPNSSDIEAYLMFEDINDSKVMELTTKEEAETDPLTGLLNRKAFAAKLEEIIHRSSENGGLNALLLIDMDGFKLINDNFGHSVGDQVLIDAGKTIRSLVDGGDPVCRLGGDEFLVCICGMPDRESIFRKAKQICALTRRSFSFDIQLTISLGIAVFPDDGNNFETLYRNADKALYRVKGNGKDNCTFYRPEMTVNPDKPDPSPAQKSVLPKHRMLIVDDNEINRDFLQSVFRNEFTVDTADCGEQALITLRRYEKETAIVLLNLMMPGMSGFDVLEKIRKNRETQLIPVIVVSSVDDRETNLHAIRLGAYDFISKPVDAELLRIRVKFAIERSEVEYLRMQNEYLSIQRDEIEKIRMILEDDGTAIAEYDSEADSFRYDRMFSDTLSGTFDGRPIWEIFSNDGVSSPADAQKLKDLILNQCTAAGSKSQSLYLPLKSDSGFFRSYRVKLLRCDSHFTSDSKLLITFTKA